MKYFPAKLVVTVVCVAPIYVMGLAVAAEEAPISSASEDCIACHASTHPGIVADWKRSLHSRITPAQAMKKPKLQRRVSSEKMPENLANVAVGCAECHTMRAESHKDTFEHGDQKVHIVVSPGDCAVCHSEEATQFEQNLMSFARKNLVQNKLYETLVKSVNGIQTLQGMKTTISDPDPETNADSCYHCHGTEVQVKGKVTRDTDAGEMEFPVLEGWPNSGVGRFNTDGSKGSCSACHSRHQFAIQAARQPYTCSQCHKGPDVPAYPAFDVSKHGNLAAALKGEWKLTEVPWTVGKDFSAPTCAVCHVSLLVNAEGEIVAKRTHQMSDRLPWRILGLIYAHPHPQSPDTSIIVNKDGIQLPTTFTNERASQYLIDQAEMTKRRETLHKVCTSCHTSEWVKGHWKRLENTIETSNQMTLTATKIMLQAWDKGVAQRENLFDEAIEKQWVQQWLFYANSTRFASAMMGADYGVFAHGRWYMAKNIQDLLDKLKVLLNMPRAAKDSPAKE